MSVIDAIILLLNSSSKDIVYYSLGALINLMTSEEIKYYFLCMKYKAVLWKLNNRECCRNNIRLWR